MLLLFDIDGTLLLRAFAEHRAALHDAVREVCGVEDPAAVHVEAAGRTDAEIARQILLRSGISAGAAEAHATDVQEAACRAYARRCPDDLSATVAPGVSELLDGLEGTGARIALLSGNYEPIAWLKLGRAGLAGHFERGQGAFGSDHVDRAALPPIARQRAGENGTPHPREQTLVIGDTPNDVACARADGVGCIAIATGPYGAGELQGADAVVADAAELAGLLQTRLAA